MTPQTPPAADAAITPQPGAPGAAPPPAAGTPPAADAELAALKAKVVQLSTSTAEAQRAAEFWRGKAERPAEKPAPAAAAEDDTDLLDLIATKGVKGLKDLLKTHGYVSKEEVDALVNNKASQLSIEQQLYEDFPELKNKNSEFFQQTATEYNTLKNQGVPEHLAMQMAAKSTALQFLETGKTKTRQQRTDDAKTQKEQERLARIAAQGGERGGRGSVEDETDEEITPAEEKVIRGMLLGQPGKDGKPMNLAEATEAFKTRAKAGVNVSRRSR